MFRRTAVVDVRGLLAWIAEGNGAVHKDHAAFLGGGRAKPHSNTPSEQRETRDAPAPSWLNPRAVARILHGIQSPAFPSASWSRAPGWGAHRGMDFAELERVAGVAMRWGGEDERVEAVLGGGEEASGRRAGLGDDSGRAGGGKHKGDWGGGGEGTRGGMKRQNRGNGTKRRDLEGTGDAESARGVRARKKRRVADQERMGSDTADSDRDSETEWSDSDESSGDEGVGRGDESMDVSAEGQRADDGIGKVVPASDEDE